MLKNRIFSEKLIEFAMTVDTWSYFYSYIAEPLTHLQVNEFIHLETLEFHGTLLRPNVKAEMPATIRIACEKPSKEGEEIRYDRPVLGNLDAKKRLFEAYLLLPAAHVTRLTSIAASDRIKVVRLMATKLIGRKALVRSVNLFTEM